MPEQADSQSILNILGLHSPYEDYHSADLPTLDHVWNLAVSNEIPKARAFEGHRSISDEEIKRLINTCISEINIIEKAARNSEKWHFSYEQAKRIKLIINFSAPGTYYKMSKDDRYNGNGFARGMDRQRADTSAKLGIILAGQIAGHDYNHFRDIPLLEAGNTDLNSKREHIHKDLRESGIRFVYLGRRDEGEAIDRVIHSKSTFIPPDIVDVIYNNTIDNTYDQVTVLKDYLEREMWTHRLSEGDTIVMPLGPQAIRVLRYAQEIQAIPSGIDPMIFPIGTSKSGFPTYPTNEIKGTIFHAMTNKAAIQPYPYSVVGHSPD